MNYEKHAHLKSGHVSDQTILFLHIFSQNIHEISIIVNPSLGFSSRVNCCSQVITSLYGHYWSYIHQSYTIGCANLGGPCMAIHSTTSSARIHVAVVYWSQCASSTNRLSLAIWGIQCLGETDRSIRVSLMKNYCKRARILRRTQILCRQIFYNLIYIFLKKMRYFAGNILRRNLSDSLLFLFF